MAKPPYPIVTVPPGIVELPEQLGTKEKFWLRMDDELYLLKFGREGTGENWAEKVACEICDLLELPHAHYDLAIVSGRECVISETIVPTGGRLILGNEIINHISPQYDKARAYQQKEHTVSRVLAALARFTRPNYAESWDQFLGYLMLDALIGNTDRHHENWGLVVDRTRRVRLAPTFDHASSLGRELTDAERQNRLTTKDRRFAVSAFASKARSALYGASTDVRPLSTILAFREAAKVQPLEAHRWLGRLESISMEQVAEIFDRVPASIMTPAAKEFAMDMLSHNRGALLELRFVVK